VAALELNAKSERESSASHGVLLLGAIQTIMGERECVATAELLRTLNADDELPFGAKRRGEGMDARGLAGLLRPYGIRPQSVRIDDKTPKGYRYEDFIDAWSRYVRPSSGEAQQAQHPQHDTDPPHEDPHKHWDVADVADVADMRGMGATSATSAATGPNADSPDAEFAGCPPEAEDAAGADLAERIIREFDLTEAGSDAFGDPGDDGDWAVPAGRTNVAEVVPDPSAERRSPGRLAYLRERGNALRCEVAEGAPTIADLTDDEIVSIFPGSTIERIEQPPNTTESYEDWEAGRALQRNGHEQLATRQSRRFKGAPGG
jgi:hypothetical protein